jgi:DNA adenine methylase
MYLDPPYPGNGANYRHNMRESGDHHKLAERLSSTKCRWILSSYDTPEVRELFSGNVIIPVSSSSGMKTGVDEEKEGRHRTINREILITNFIPHAGQGSLLNS